MMFAAISPNYAKSRKNSNGGVKSNTNGTGKRIQWELTKSSWGMNGT